MDLEKTVRFGFKGYEVEFPLWSKHHKVLGTRVKRIYEDGREILSKDGVLKNIVEDNKNLLKEKHVNLFNRETGKRSVAKDYYLPVRNLDYQEADFEQYFVGAMNTDHDIYVRLNFLIDDARFILDYKYKTSGSYATSFKDLICDMDSVENMIEEVLGQEKPIEEVGIEEGEYGGYTVVVATGIGEVTDIQVEKRELLNSLVGVEIYRFDTNIHEG